MTILFLKVERLDGLGLGFSSCELASIKNGIIPKAVMTASIDDTTIARRKLGPNGTASITSVSQTTAKISENSVAIAIHLRGD